LTDLKLIEGISNTVWDTLVESGKIKIEPPEHEENVTEELPIWKNKCRR
jgi:hypothetical protein